MKEENNIDMEKIPEMQQQYVETIDSDPQYSLAVDPQNLYRLSDKQKDFIKNYIDLKDIEASAKLSEMSEEESIACFNSYAFKEEVARIKRALFFRAKKEKMLTMDEIGGYLSSVLMDEVPTADRLSPKDKLAAAKMIIDINLSKRDVIEKGDVIDIEDLKDISEKLENSSSAELKEIIYSRDKMKKSSEEKEKLIDKIAEKSEVSNEDRKSLMELSTEELKEIIKEQRENNDI